MEGPQVKVAVLGAGPAGLYFAISMKRRNPAHEVTVFERNRPDDTFGWGVVLSAETLDNLAANDAVSAAWIRAYFAYWDDIAVIHENPRTAGSGRMPISSSPRPRPSSSSAARRLGASSASVT